MILFAADKNRVVGMVIAYKQIISAVKNRRIAIAVFGSSSKRVNSQESLTVVFAYSKHK